MKLFLTSGNVKNSTIRNALAATTYDNFARDFGERFVPGYKPTSTVDYLLNSPFKE